MIRPASLTDAATDAAYAYQRGPEALAELESDVNSCAARASELQIEAEKAIKELASLAKLEGENRDARTELRNQHRKDNTADLDAWRLGGKVDVARQAARFAGQVAQISWLTERDTHLVNVLRPKLHLASLRADASYVLAGADTLFAQSAVAAYNRHAALQQVIAIDGIAQLPESEGLANKLWKQAVALMGRAAEVNASADTLEARIAMRETI